MAAKALPSQEVLRQLLRCDPDTGMLFWKERGPEWFADKDEKYTARRAANIFNRLYAGKEALTAIGIEGYKYGNLFGRKIYAHRAIYIILHGDFSGEVDHVNGNRSDNRASNLRAVSRLDNTRNKGLPEGHPTGTLGVLWDRGRWKSTISLNNRSVYLGRFENFSDAVAARKAAEDKYNFHDNHGKRPTHEAG